MDRYFMFIDRRTQWYQNVSSSQLNLQIQGNLIQNSSKLFYGYWQTDSKVYGKGQNTQNNQHDIEEQSWKTDATQPQDIIKL